MTSHPFRSKYISDPKYADDPASWVSGGCVECGVSLDAHEPGHRHRYGLVPVWRADGSEVESWWWCTDHPAGEWAKIEDDPDAAYAIPEDRRDRAIREAISILEHTSDRHATDARLTLLALASKEPHMTEPR